jgi:O-antigen ligase
MQRLYMCVVNKFIFPLALLAAFLSVIGIAAVVHQQILTTLGAVSGLPNATLAPRPASIRAINVALEQYPELTPIIPQLRPFGWVRQKFASNILAWEEWDRILSQTSSAPLNVIAVLSMDDEAHHPPPKPADFARFASDFATRYGHTIDVYQIWDEPNIAVGWGNTRPSAPEYTALLQAAYNAIHTADPQATVIAAALAPTIEEGPDNISDLTYLQQLYDLKANNYFDAAAGKPYGFFDSPTALPDPQTLNFARFTLLRQIMERNDDGDKLLWAGNFGWNTRPSPWGNVSPDQQAGYTQAAYHRAETEWAWAGPMALENFQPATEPTDLRWGFALLDSSGNPSPLSAALSNPPTTAFIGNYTAQHPAAHYSGDWAFSPLGADIPQDYTNARIEFRFIGSDIALHLRRGDYRAYLYITIDGAPANQLPRNERGSYIILTSPELNPGIDTIIISTGLDPTREHLLIITPDRGWDQWAIAGFSVGKTTPNNQYLTTIFILSIIFIISILFIPRTAPHSLIDLFLNLWQRLGSLGQLIITAIIATLFAITTWLTWGDDLLNLTRRTPDVMPITLTAITAGLFYFSPSLILSIIFLFILLGLFYLRLDLGFAFIALLIPFYLQPTQLWQKFSSPVEITLALLVIAILLRNLRRWLLKVKNGEVRWQFTALDYAIAALVILGLASALTAEFKGYSLREWRLVFLEPALFYAAIRLVRLDRFAFWRVVDFFILGATLMSIIGLYQYVTGANLITAEEGLARLRSVYGSPNNVALYLERALPLTLSFALLGQHKGRRLAYSLCAAIMMLTFVLTFSKGGLLLGLPAALSVILIGWQSQRGLVIVSVALCLGLVALPILSQLPRFADLLNFSSGTSFFRVKLWQSAWHMALDHPLLGVGPDNFLYAYRSHYLLPEAWQEPNLSHPHNWVLDFLSRLGAPGLLVGLWLFAAFARAALEAYRAATQTHWRDERAFALGALASLAATLTHGLVDHSFFLMDLALAFVLLGALVHVKMAAYPSQA